MVGIGLVGYGYWGPNLARNFATTAGCRLLSICDRAGDRAQRAARTYPSCPITADFSDLLGNPEIDAIVIATPVASHYTLARQALLAGKDVLVEKPFTRTSVEASELLQIADGQGRIIAVDHTFLYTDAVRKIRELIEGGELGEILYIDSVRTNLGLFQGDHNVIYDLAPHEFSIVLHWLEKEPISVLAQGACHSGNGIENVAYVHLEFEDNQICHFHFNWLAPVKIRQTIVAGSRKMIVYDDMHRSEKVKLYDKGISLKSSEDIEEVYHAAINYRMGDMVAPHLDNMEALALEAAHFVECVRDRKQPLSDGHAGMKVVQILEAAQQSLMSNSARIPLEGSRPPIATSRSVAARTAAASKQAPPPFSRIRADTVIGKNVALPGFCNLYGCEIGDECTIGPFVEIQQGAKLGRKVKVQSHSFICEGVTIEDEVFVGHGVTFINDRFPRATTASGAKKGSEDWSCVPTIVRKRAAIGSNASILCGLTIGEGAVVGAGSVVTRDVPPHTIVAGNPARVLRAVRPEDELGPTAEAAGVSIPLSSTVDQRKKTPAIGVPFLDLPKQHLTLKTEFSQVFDETMKNAAFVGGAALEDFEMAFARFSKCRHALGVASGTDALRFALLATGVGQGQIAVTVPNTFVATSAAITQTGATVDFVDIDPSTCLMDPNRLEDYLKSKSKSKGPRPTAIVPVHLYGQCADMDAIAAIAQKYELKVIEDAAQAHGSTYRGRAAGSMGDAAAFSFYPGKNLGACGEGGAVVTDDAEVARRVALLRDHGRSGKHSHVLEGYNGRLDAMQAGFLAVKLTYLPSWNARRNHWAAVYNKALADLQTIRPVAVHAENLSSYHLYVVRCANRDKLQKFLGDKGIATGVHYPIALHLQECYRDMGYSAGAFPRAEKAAAEVLSLPIYPEMESAQVERVIEAVREFDAQQTCDLKAA